MTALCFTPATIDTAYAASGDCVTSGSQQATCTYTFIGAAQNWIVPDGVTQATFDLYGAQGRGGNGGRGGRMTATLAVTPGAIYQIRVGGRNYPFNGRGASDVWGGTFTLNDRYSSPAPVEIRASQTLPVAPAATQAAAAGTVLLLAVVVVARRRAAGQADPTTSNPVLFTAQFSEAVADFTAADVTLSGTADLSGATITLSGGPSTYEISVDGLAGSGTVIATIGANVANDAAGNGNTASNSTDNTVTVNFDNTGPVITPNIVGTLGNSGWCTGDVTVSWSVVDAESAISSQSGCEAQHVTSDTAAPSGPPTFTCSATSSGGTTSQSVTIKRDATAPTLSAAASSAPNANGWYNSDVTVHFTCADELSGVVSCPADETLSSEGSAVNSTAPTISDQAGNRSAASNVVTVQIDKGAPVVTVTGVSNNASYTLGSVPTAGCSTTDALSGVATQATISVTGGGSPLGADGTGSLTATCSGGTDNAGNNGSASVTYRVAYNWSGFLQPVDNLPTVNTINAGPPIPVRFSLGGDYGLNIFATGYPASQQVSCGGGGGSTSPIEETATAGNSSLQYDPATQRYSYAWKTDKAWAGTCRQLIVKLIDGTEQIALFQFNGKGRNGGESDTEGDAEVVRQQLFLPLVNNQ